jgi:hypothetical protein
VLFRTRRLHQLIQPICMQVGDSGVNRGSSERIWLYLGESITIRDIRYLVGLF